MTGDAPCYLCLAEVVFVGKSSSLHNFAEHGNLLGRGLCYSAAFTSERSHAGVYYLVSGVDVKCVPACNLPHFACDMLELQ